MHLTEIPSRIKLSIWAKLRKFYVKNSLCVLLLYENWKIPFWQSEVDERIKVMFVSFSFVSGYWNHQFEQRVIRTVQSCRILPVQLKAQQLNICQSNIIFNSTSLYALNDPIHCSVTLPFNILHCLWADFKIYGSLILIVVEDLMFDDRGGGVDDLRGPQALSRYLRPLSWLLRSYSCFRILKGIKWKYEVYWLTLSLNDIILKCGASFN